MKKNYTVEEINFYNNSDDNKMERFYPHALRHTFAKRCFEKGMSPRYIQELMGHTNYSTTLVYTHLLEEKKKEEIQKI